MFNKYLIALYHCFWYVFAFIILNAAVIVTVVRLAIPEIGGYTSEIQSWVSNQMKHQVVIGKIDADWQGWSPNIYLKNIDLYSGENAKLITRLDSAQININILASIKAREIIPNYLSVSGLELNVLRRHDGSISITNDESNIHTTTNKSSDLSIWLLKQKYIILENASITWHDEKSLNEKMLFSDVKVQLKTDKQRVQLEVNIILPKKYGQFLKVLVDINGNILTPEWGGSVYIETENFHPTSLLNYFKIKSIGGIASVKLWTKWEQSKLIDFNSELNYSSFSLINNNHILKVKNLALNLIGNRIQSKDWLLNMKVDELRTENISWPTSSHQLLIEKDLNNDYEYDGYFSYLYLEDVLPFLITSNAIPDKFKVLFEQHTFKGEITDSIISYKPSSLANNLVQFESAFNNFSLISNNQNYSISGLKGSLNVGSDKINIQFNDSNPKIRIITLHDEPLSLSGFNTDLEINYNDMTEIIIHDFNLTSKDLSINSSGRIRFDDKSPFIDMILHVDETNIENIIPTYLPKQINPELRVWFNNALSNGKLLSGDLLFRGHLSDYPFYNAEGHFKSIINIENITLKYNEEWPSIDNFSAEIVLNNDDLTISSRSGNLYDAKINKLSAEIKNYNKGNNLLNITGSLEGHTNDITHFVNQSPLKEKKYLRESINNIIGDFELDLKLVIPLDEDDTNVEGIMAFTDATMESNIPGLSLESVNGKINFINNSIWANNIHALYHSLPVTLNIPKIDPEESTAEIYEISGFANKGFIVNQLGSFFPSFNKFGKNISPYFDGGSKWSLLLKTIISDDNITIRDVELSSDLSGIEINLPYPFDKRKKDSRLLTLSTRLTDASISKINFNFDNIFFTDVNIDNSENFIVKNILVGLGQQHEESSQTEEISIQGDLDELNLSKWIDIIAVDNNVQSHKSAFQKTSSITGEFTIGELQVLKNNFADVKINLSNSTEGWKVFFDGSEIKGHAQLLKTDKNKNDKLIVELESLSLHESETENYSSHSEIDKIPELDVRIKSFNYKGSQLGQLELQTNNIENGINISNLSISKPDLNITANGEWIHIDGVDRSEFYTKLESESIETMLATFNYSSANIQEGQTTIEMNANWMDTPMNFSMKKVIGELDMKIGKGQFLDIDPSAGRLFGLLSIQTLPRRLALDFTDLFKKGFAFDSISGNFNMDQGHAYTNNLELIGPAADIIVSGRTGFVTEDYDQIATITPKVSNSLPVASALFGPIGVGVGAVIYLTSELFKSIPDKIDEILRYQYNIKGSWDNPDIIKI